MRLSLIIPCYNESAALPTLVERCAAAIAAEPALDIVLVDNGSTDHSRSLIEQAARRPRLSSVHVSPNRGYGNGILAGLRASTGEVVGWTHADLQTDPMDAVRGFSLFKDTPGWDRLYVKGKRRGRPVADVAFTAGMSLFETVLLGMPLVDINAQPNLFPRTLYESWAQPPGDFSLDLFAYYSAKAAKLEIKRFPVVFGARPYGQSHWNVDWRSKLKFINRTIEFSLGLKRSIAGRGSPP